MSLNLILISSMKPLSFFLWMLFTTSRDCTMDNEIISPLINICDILPLVVWVVIGERKYCKLTLSSLYSPSLIQFPNTQSIFITPSPPPPPSFPSLLFSFQLFCLSFKPFIFKHYSCFFMFIIRPVYFQFYKIIVYCFFHTARFLEDFYPKFHQS